MPASTRKASVWNEQGSIIFISYSLFSPIGPC
jgi:hypothetical protein